MKGRITKATSKPLAKGKSDFKRLREMRDEDIDYSDIPRLDESFWKAATLIMPEPKYRLAIPPQGRDHDVVEWLKKRGKGYQTRINAILRSYNEGPIRRPPLGAVPGSRVKPGSTYRFRRGIKLRSSG